jgi:hypothetical protein
MGLGFNVSNLDKIEVSFISLGILLSMSLGN